MTRASIDLNADVGEGCADEAILPWVSSASIACGGHAGDPETMRATIARALSLGVTIGAHPGFPDRAGFGRRVTTRDAAAIEDLVARQVETLAAHAKALGAAIAYVKPHGALYNLAAADAGVARAIARATRRTVPGAALVLLARCPSLATISAEGVTPVAEGFVDRGYLASGELAPRGAPGATIDDPVAAARRAVDLALRSRAVAVDGSAVRVAADTLCIHGDGLHAAAIAERVRRELEDAGLRIAPFAP